MSRRFFKTGPGEYGEGDVFLGVRVPRVRAVARTYRSLPLNDVRRLLRSRIHEERLFALVILTHQFSKAGPAGKKRIFDLYSSHTRFVNSWDLVDGSAPHIVGAYLDRRSKQPLYRFARSRSLWERRIAIMATLHFIRRREFTETFKIARMLLADDEDLIHKAVGWMLREVGNRDVSAAQGFLAAHYAIMPRTMLRYAIEKFPERTRRRYLEGTA